jgi:hypothetical protein
VLPAAASADARVSTQAPCVSYVGGNFYSGSGTNVTTDTGSVVLTCHLTLVSGTPVSEPTRTTYGTCDTLQLPSGRAELNCHYSKRRPSSRAFRSATLVIPEPFIIELP